MRLLYIRVNPEYIDSISIEYSAFPQSLLHLHITPMRRATNFKSIVQIGRKPRGVQLVTDRDNTFTMPHKASLHIGKFTKLQLRAFGNDSPS